MPKSLHHFACCWNLAIAPSSLKSPLPFSIFYFPFQFSLLGVWTSFQFHSYQLSSLQQLVSRVLIFLIRIYTIVCRESVPFTYNIYGPPFSPHHFSHLPESSSKCWCPEIHRRLICQWECAGDWH